MHPRYPGESEEPVSALGSVSSAAEKGLECPVFSGDSAVFPWGKGFMHCKVQTILTGNEEQGGDSVFVSWDSVT